MEPKQNKYPIFEANQVLSNSNLNQVFAYLDEQERLTRANLIGIGIVCGLEITLEVTGTVPAIHLSKGCGVTSEGYLIVEPQDVVLVSYRNYTLPDDLAYPQFKDHSAPDKPQYPLWELFPAGVPDTTPLETPANFLSDKAVLLFYELKKEGLRTCSPNECTDKGAEVTATVRRLLIKQADLNKIIAEANALPTNSTTADLEKVLLAQLNLPDLRLPRYDVPNTDPVTTNEILAAFLAVFPKNKMAQTTGNAFTAAYQAFKPVLLKTYPNDPFSDFAKKFGFLDTAPEGTDQVRFLQYYYDLFDDFLKAYDEFCRKGAELLCVCCPSQGLFPRHLILGHLSSGSEAKPDIFRHSFLASPAIAGKACIKELQQLFQRLVEMTVQFTHNPPLPKPSNGSETDEQIRLTPSTLGSVPQSDKAIPYYFLQDGTPPLYHLWNYEKTLQYKASQNLSYRSDEYTPAAPDFVTNALSYDLEPYNFLRIEGHLGKDYSSVLKTLFRHKTNYRLPIEIIALRTGALDETIPVDLSKETCRFQDLESLYNSLREQLLTALCQAVIYFYDIPIAQSNFKGGKPEHPLLQTYAPHYQYKQNTMGAWFENNLKILSVPYVDLDQNNINEAEILKIVKLLLIGTSGLSEDNFSLLILIFYLTHLSEALPDHIDKLNYAGFENKCEDVLALIRLVRSAVAAKLSTVLKDYIPQEDFIDHLDQLLFACKHEPFRAVQEEYERRLNEVRQKQLFSYFLEKNPGVQHKAGVPMGGTFIIVYHVNSKPKQIKSTLDFVEVRKEVFTKTTPGTAKSDSDSIAESIKRLSTKPLFREDKDFLHLIEAFTGKVPDFRVPPVLIANPADEIIRKTVDNIKDGTVIADFYLPYLCCSDCSPIQFVLPVPPLDLAVDLGCTDPTKGTAELALEPMGGKKPFFYQLDQQPFKELTGKLELTQGSHTIKIRDSAGSESALQSLTVPMPLTIGEETYIDNVSEQTYTVSFGITGGTAPYSSESSGTVSGSIYTSAPVESGKSIKVEITDSAGCTSSKEFQHTVNLPCNLPCEGISRRCAYRLWLQPPFKDSLYKGYKQESEIRFQFNGENIALVGSDTLLQFSVGQLNQDFHNTVGRAVKMLNEAINQALVTKFGEELGRNRLLISYEPNDNDPFGILWIEYFVCEKFSIEFNFSFSRPSPAFSLTMQYTDDAATLINRRLNNKKMRVPAFDCRERNQCLDTDYEELCKNPDFKPFIGIEPIGENRFMFFGEVTNIDRNDVIAWVWDVIASMPSEPIYVGEQVEVSLQIPDGPVRLTIITREGCFGVVEENILR